MKKDLYKDQQLDIQEKKISNAIAKDEFVSVADKDQYLTQAVNAAHNSLKRDKRVNLRFSERDLYLVKIKALEEGMPYQTLISSVIHKYLKGYLVETSH